MLTEKIVLIKSNSTPSKHKLKQWPVTSLIWIRFKKTGRELTRQVYERIRIDSRQEIQTLTRSGNATNEMGNYINKTSRRLYSNISHPPGNNIENKSQWTFDTQTNLGHGPTQPWDSPITPKRGKVILIQSTHIVTQSWTGRDKLSKKKPEQKKPKLRQKNRSYAKKKPKFGSHFI